MPTPRSISFLSSLALASLAGVDITGTGLDRNPLTTDGYPAPKRSNGYCLCGRRISENKSQCLACKQAQEGA